MDNTGERREEVCLWEAMRGGEREALETLFRRYYSPLYDYGINLVANANNVKDAIQELFLKLWRDRASLSTPRSIKAYLLVSIRRILMDGKKRKRKRYQRNRKYIEDAFSRVFTKEDLIVRREIEEGKRERLVQAINQLSNRQKETLFLRYYHGLTNREIAKIMNINYQSVKNNLYRALKNVRGIMESIPNSV
ncbi:RNA polymerase sigma factor [Fodinibius sediminis]|nr:sigma-70 family RNA polymerase sigma factor [Fodinibius sediminis]